VEEAMRSLGVPRNPTIANSVPLLRERSNVGDRKQKNFEASGKHEESWNLKEEKKTRKRGR
jgi:hypothetical protein